MLGRIIAIGDIHGCHSEFAELLQRVAPRPDDRLILLGDLINRGPDSLSVLDLARDYGAISVLGNHEKRLLDFYHTGDATLLNGNDADTAAKLRPADWTYLEQMLPTYTVPELEVVFVHGGFLPTTPWSAQPVEVITQIQVIDEDGQAAKRSSCPTGTLWADRWTGPPFVVYGHTPRPEIYKLKWSVGIDTACVMGGHLTAFILPEKRCVQVKAHRRYDK